MLVVSRDRGLVVLLEGESEGVARLLGLWRTSSVDVDKRGRPCKERLLQVTYPLEGLRKGEERKQLTAQP